MNRHNVMRIAREELQNYGTISHQWSDARKSKSFIGGRQIKYRVHIPTKTPPAVILQGIATRIYGRCGATVKVKPVTSRYWTDTFYVSITQ